MPPPPRPKKKDRVTGTQFLQRIQGMTQAQIDEEVFKEATRGNIPDFMRPENFYEIAVFGRVNGKDVEVRIQVALDYLAIGDNNDYVRVPVSPLLAQRLADRFGYVLPTSKIVDVIDDESRATKQDIKFVAAPEIAMLIIDPSTGRQVYEKWNTKGPYGPYEGKWMMSVEFTEAQNRLVNEQISQRRLRGVRAGQNKDIIYHPETVKRKSACIYHPREQGVNYVSHEDTYADYSHGARFISGKVRVIVHNRDGTTSETTMDMAQLLRNKDIYRLLSTTRMDISRIYRRNKTTLMNLTPQPQKHADVQPEEPKLLRRA
jgi:hypothetical protein